MSLGEKVPDAMIRYVRFVSLGVGTFVGDEHIILDHLMQDLYNVIVSLLFPMIPNRASYT